QGASGPVAAAGIVEGTVTTGPSVSTTVTLNLSLDVPPGEVAEQATVVKPSGNVDPDAGEQLIEALSVAVTTYETLAPAGPEASARMSAGSVRMGAVAPPVTVTLNE